MNEMNSNSNAVIPEKQDNKKSKNLGYKIIILILFIIIIVLVWLLFNQKQITTSVTNEKDLKAKILQEDLNSLMSEHDSIKVEYAQLADRLAQKDSLIMNQANDIKKLIASQADYKRIKKKLEYLRSITQGYVHQIDSLYTVNKELKEENVAITNKFHKSLKDNQELQKDKEQLKDKVTLASVLKATNLSAIAVRVTSGGKEKTTDKASRAEKLKICFSIMDNPVATSGIRTVYLRIARPDKKIITEGKEDIYTFDFNGQKLQYSIKKDIDYENKAQSLCMFWDKKDKSQDAMKGTYIVSVYVDNNMIGETQFALK